MKKIILLVALILCCGFLFAGEIDFSFGGMFISHNLEVNVSNGYDYQTVKAKYNTKGIAFDITMCEVKENAKVGLLSYISFGLPSTHAVEVNGTKQEQKIDGDYNIFAFGLGPVFVPYKTSSLKVYLSPCLSMRYELTATALDTFFGIGGMASVNYYFNESFFATCKMKGEFDFMYLGDAEENYKNSFMFFPSIGLGIKY